MKISFQKWRKEYDNNLVTLFVVEPENYQEQLLCEAIIDEAQSNNVWWTDSVHGTGYGIEVKVTS